MPVMAVGVGSNLIVRDGGVLGVVIRLPKSFASVSAEPGHRILAGDPTGRQQDILVSEFVGLTNNRAAVLVTAAQFPIRHAEKFVVVAAQRREPRDLHRPGRSTNRHAGR